MLAGDPLHGSFIGAGGTTASARAEQASMLRLELPTAMAQVPLKRRFEKLFVIYFVVVLIVIRQVGRSILHDDCHDCMMIVPFHVAKCYLPAVPSRANLLNKSLKCDERCCLDTGRSRQEGS
eukprot:COSAG05_NODE_1420_length_4927_cov_7.611226_6_plen_122_part_00